MYDIHTRTIATRDVLSINRHVHLADTPAFFEEAFARLRAGGPGVAGIDGAPYLVFYGEVSDDSDGPLELCRPISAERRRSRPTSGVQRRTEAGARRGLHPADQARDGLAGDAPRRRRARGLDRPSTAARPVGPLRQVLIADQRTASDDTPVCDLSIPLR